MAAFEQALHHGDHLACERLGYSESELLSFSRMSRQPFELHPVNLERLLQEIIQQQAELQPPRAHITVHSPLPLLLGHEALLTQCLANLLGNAVKFVAPSVSPQVHVRAESIGSQVRLWVEDNGLGIAPEAQPRLFKLFSRLYPDNQFEGTGLGLAIVRRAVERRGGQVGVESVPGQGSRFWLQLHRAG
jgi:signal transduction histidine kinase